MKYIEQWRTAVYDGEIYEGLYKVSNLGKILSLNYRNTGKAELMNPGTDKDGYLQVKLRKNGEYKTCSVHRLVAFTFLENPENKPEVNHKIEGKQGKTMNMVIFNEDGSVDEERTTIEWVTPKENSNYATRNERISKAMTNGKRSKRVIQFTLNGEFVREWPSVSECERNGYNFSHIAACCRGERKTHKGFLWMFAEDYKEKILVDELQKENEELKSKYEELKSRYEELKTDYIVERQLKDKYANQIHDLPFKQSEFDELKKKYDNLQIEYITLKNGYKPQDKPDKPETKTQWWEEI